VEKFHEKIARIVRERIEIVEYDQSWPLRFEEEKQHLLDCLPPDLVRRVEHFGSTAVPGLCAKPIIDILVEASDLARARMVVVPILEGQGYEYIWRPSFGGDIPPYYAWFFKRDDRGSRTHHIHFVESHFAQWETLYFRDYLVEHPEVAAEYDRLKKELSSRHASDREAYTMAKGDFIRKVTERAKSHYGERNK
jgi:GrpB-like predicted nucleotidyltransferase (UPF0157 family)